MLSLILGGQNKVLRLAYKPQLRFRFFRAPRCASNRPEPFLFHCSGGRSRSNSVLDLNSDLDQLSPQELCRTLSLCFAAVQNSLGTLSLCLANR